MSSILAKLGAAGGTEAAAKAVRVAVRAGLAAAGLLLTARAGRMT